MTKPDTAEDAPAARAVRWPLLRNPDFWLWVIIFAINAVAAWMSMDGTLRGWPWAGLDPRDVHRYGLPVIGEGMVVAWLLMGEKAIRQKRSPYPYWAIAAGFAAIVVLLNIGYSSDLKHPLRQAAIFGLASAGSLALTFAKFALRYIGRQVAEGLRAGARPKVLLTLRVIEYPRLYWRAHLIAGRIGHKLETDDKGQPVKQPLTVDDVIGLADLWREVYQDYRATSKDGKKGDKQLAKRTAWNAVKERCGLTVYKPQRLEVGRTEFTQPQRQPAAASQPKKKVIETVDEAIEVFLAEEETPARTKPPAAATEDVAVDPAWLDRHAKHIELVKEAVPDWATRELSVDDVQDLGDRYPNKGLANRGNATRIAACMRKLRADAAKASK